MRFGLVGTGFWAREVYVPALGAGQGIDFAGVWGRDQDKTAGLAAAANVTPYPDVDAMIDDVDAVAFAVPPDVQAGIALRAARAGRHVLLEKPIALDVDAANALVTAVEEAGVASTVFFTCLFDPPRRAWLDELRRIGGWEGASAQWLSNIYQPGSPFAESPWRRVKGGLWDVGPHALSVVIAALGSVTEVAAASGPRDVVTMMLTHETGAVSTATTSLTVPPAAAHAGLTVWGAPGRREMPAGDTDGPATFLRSALHELVDQARTGRRDTFASVRLGRDVVAVLAEAQHRLERR